jgi:hypothetical protein
LEAVARDGALGALPTADIGAAAGAAPGVVGAQAARGEHDAAQLGLRAHGPAAHAAALGNGYEVASSSASPVGAAASGAGSRAS